MRQCACLWVSCLGAVPAATACATSGGAALYVFLIVVIITITITANSSAITAVTVIIVAYCKLSCCQESLGRRSAGHLPAQAAGGLRTSRRAGTLLPCILL